MAEERVTVIIITHNRCRELCRTLARLRQLPERPPVIVVDNGSTDSTATVVRTGFPEATLLTPGANLGAVGRNLAAATARTPYLAFCDDDVWYEPGALIRAADLLDLHPRLAVVTASIIVEPYGRVDAICAEMAASPLERPSGFPGHPLLSFLAGVSTVRRRAFLDAEGFSPRLWLGGEEELLASDLARAGWHLAYVPEVVAHHHASARRDPHLRRRHGIRNTLWFTWLRRPGLRAFARTLRLLRQLPRDRVSLAGLTDAVRGVPWVVRERRVVPPHLERGYRLLDREQLAGATRRYVSAAGTAPAPTPPPR